LRYRPNWYQLWRHREVLLSLISNIAHLENENEARRWLSYLGCTPQWAVKIYQATRDVIQVRRG
jgi:hypothetical protein